ncbi:hypothetical protein L5M38_24030, partial [Shewanella sp. SM101]|uniref:hypothetical protein n=1 Tax=Shewanella sp. SM101 TaxID=2912789 RepID=UPI0021D94819
RQCGKGSSALEQHAAGWVLRVRLAHCSAPRLWCWATLTRMHIAVSNTFEKYGRSIEGIA